MTPTRIVNAGALAIILGSPILGLPAAAAAAQTLDIKTGLWETTTTMTVTGLPGAEAKPQTRTEKICITRDTLEEDRFQHEDADCTRMVLQKTKTVLRMKLSCATEGSAGEGEFHYQALSRERLKGGFTMSSRAPQAKTSIKISSSIEGRWLADACGTVRPE